MRVGGKMVASDDNEEILNLKTKIAGLLETLTQVNYQNTMMLKWVNGAVITVDRQGLVTQANSTALKTLGWTEEELVGRHLHDTAHHSQEDGSEYPYDFCPEFAAIEDGSSHHVNGDVFWHKDGTSFSVDFIVCPTRDEENQVTGAVVTFRNLTEQRMQEAKRIQSMKLESIGELAAGIAHEINTPIQFIGSNVSFLRDSFDDLLQVIRAYAQLRVALMQGGDYSDMLPEIESLEETADIGYLEDEAPKAFEQTLDGVARVSKLVLGLKGYAHSSRNESKSESDINTIISNSLIVCNNAFKYVAELETDFADLPLIKVHPGDIGQVVINMVVNAAQAITDKKEKTGTMGRIGIRTFLQDNDVIITITDTGGGIPENVRQRIFDPFFTTKKVGQGSGQGLAICRTIIHEKHQGEITFESTSGQGTTFIIRLPLVAG
jgi:two-component system, NtrC family, sensor kinase